MGSPRNQALVATEVVLAGEGVVWAELVAEAEATRAQKASTPNE